MKQKIKQFMDQFPGCLIMTLDDKQAKGATPKREKGFVTRNIPASYIKNINGSDLIEKNKQGYGIFIAFNSFNKQRRLAANVDKINAWAMEIDGEDKQVQLDKIHKSPLPPSIIVETRNSYHVYWLSVDGKPNNFKKISKRLIDYFDSDGSICSADQLLRIPFFNHMKNEPFPVKLYHSDYSLRFTEEEMLKAFPEKEIKKVIKQKIESDSIFWNEVSKLDNKHILQMMSGNQIVNNEVYTFRSRGSGGEYIDVNGEPADAWIDEHGMIGSQKGGSPTFIQWCAVCGKSKKEVAEWIKENCVNMLPPGTCDDTKTKIIKKIKSNHKTTKILDRYLTPIKKNTKTWGVKSLDTEFNKVGDGEYILLIGEAGQGKTSFCLHMALSNAKAGNRVLFLSLEMAKERIEERYIDLWAGITREDREKAIYTDEQKRKRNDCIEELEHKNFTILDMRDLGTHKKDWDIIKAIMNDYDLIFIDNFSKIVPRENNEEISSQSKISEDIADYVEGNDKTIVMLHHYPKGAGKPRGMEARGSQKIIDDISMHVSLHPNEEHPEIVLFKILKSRYANKGEMRIEFDKGRYNPCYIYPMTPLIKI